MDLHIPPNGAPGFDGCKDRFEKIPPSFWRTNGPTFLALKDTPQASVMADHLVTFWLQARYYAIRLEMKKNKALKKVLAEHQSAPGYLQSSGEISFPGLVKAYGDAKSSRDTCLADEFRLSIDRNLDGGAFEPTASLVSPVVSYLSGLAVTGIVPQAHNFCWEALDYFLRSFCRDASFVPLLVFGMTYKELGGLIPAYTFRLIMEWPIYVWERDEMKKVNWTHE